MSDDDAPLPAAPPLGAEELAETIRRRGHNFATRRDVVVRLVATIDQRDALIADLTRRLDAGPTEHVSSGLDVSWGAGDPNRAPATPAERDVVDAAVTWYVDQRTGDSVALAARVAKLLKARGETDG